ncbi:hypothetical protein DC522_24660, partial [Microvirga sp. KLBC 81]
MAVQQQAHENGVDVLIAFTCGFSERRRVQGRVTARPGTIRNFVWGLTMIWKETSHGTPQGIP